MAPGFLWTCLTVFLVTIAYTSGIITHWTNPKIESPNGRGTLVPHVLEGRSGRTGIIARAEVAHAYFLVYQKIKNLFAVNETTGEITITAGVAELDTETSDDKYVLVIWAKGDEFSVGTATATVLIEDLNDNAPTFDRSVYFVEVKDGIGQGVAIATIAATDIDTTSPNNEIAYTITAGDEKKTFSMDPLSGLITVRPGKSVNRAVTSLYNITISAVDQGRPPLTGTTNLVVLVARATSSTAACISVVVPLFSLVI